MSKRSKQQKDAPLSLCSAERPGAPPRSEAAETKNSEDMVQA
jgi:hypothetical protein